MNKHDSFFHCCNIECEDSNIIEDNVNGDYVCTSCGTVLPIRMIDDTREDKRVFWERDPDSIKNKHTEMVENEYKNNHFASTRILNNNQNKRRKRESCNSLCKAQFKLKKIESKNDNHHDDNDDVEKKEFLEWKRNNKMDEIKINIERFMEKMNNTITDSIRIDKTLQLFYHLLEIENKKIHMDDALVIAGLLYCSENQRGLKYIQEVSQIYNNNYLSDKKLKAAVQRIKKYIDLSALNCQEEYGNKLTQEYIVKNTIQLIPFYGNKLKLNSQCIQKAQQNVELLFIKFSTKLNIEKMHKNKELTLLFWIGITLYFVIFCKIDHDHKISQNENDNNSIISIYDIICVLNISDDYKFIFINTICDFKKLIQSK